ncbi:MULTISPECIES: hypothetical protein [unclassified Luteimonas]|uniref:hypothetical protein n=1 Tax=unclassified Luteimonas TaxID=2629088 RepID=UPI0018F09923|nr:MULTISPECIES: hypothetical protein [unclassified Luteimonas]MBJ6979125.1 hypothetical protein [Luteimonas sp. MC1895]MBJ6985141.1 hypothetical protein [Luteimonas sp. MC1750]QQO05797.1 hypothetical protein JGR68_13475 [Luteimonas sp. MC1750]
MSIEAAPPKTREELVERLADLRQQGVLDSHEEERLLSQFDSMLRDVNEQKATLEPEYKRRVRDDGLDQANAWLREAAAELGRRHGEATRAITDQLRVVTG